MDKHNEKAPFLPGSKPVTLISPKVEKIPRDKYKLVFFIFLLHGLGTLVPWNMFINAKSYFVDFKLVSSESNTTSVYATNFMAYIGFAAQVPNVIFNWLNIFVRMGGDLTKRVVYSILIELCIFFITVMLAIVDSSSWQNAFFWITMISVVLLNMVNGIYQNTIYGMAASLPVAYTGAVVLGGNMSGLFASIMDICSTYMFSSYRTAAIYYFLTAIFVLLVCFDTYFALPLTRFYRYHTTMRKKEMIVASQNDDDCTQKVPYWMVFKEALPQLINVFLTLFVTLAVFPAVHSDIKPMDKNFVIPPRMFTSVTCFFTFNLFAMLGSLTASFIRWPNPKFLCIPVLMRLIFLPLFFFCNYRPVDIVRTIPVLITNDWVYWLIGALMAYSSGYLSSLAMMYAPTYVQSKYQTTAGMFAAAMLISGIFCGILFSFLWPLFAAL